MENDELEVLRTGLRNARADLMSYRMLIHAFILSMPKQARRTLLDDFREQQSQALTVAKNQKPAVDSDSIEALLAATRRVEIAIEQLAERR